MARLTTTNGVLETTNGVLQTTVPTLEIDYFDDADIAEYGGETSFYQVQQTTVEDGSYALEGQSHSDGTETVLVSGDGDGLENYPAAGDVWRWHAYLTDTGDVAVTRFGVQGVNNDPDGYRVQLSADANVIEVAYQLNGSYNELQQTPAPIRDHLNEWLSCHVEWGAGGAMDAYLYDAAGYEIGRNTGASDTQWSTGGAGWGSFNSATQGTMYFDSARLLNAINPATIVDGFGDGDLEEYSGSTLDFSVVSSPVREGDRALQGSGINDQYSIASTAGLPAYPSQGDTFRCWMRSEDSNGRPWFYFGVQSEAADPDGYYIELEYDTETLNLAVVGGTGTTVLDSTPFAAATQTWYDYEVNWAGDGTITVSVYDEAGSQVKSLTGTDSTYSSGGVAFTAASGDLTSATSHWDFYRITS